ncbi:hypothetical protein [Streptomyces bungoensis]|uniref:hypothetical protein n=1 Tax=Streptomyces bungoensis TaxID=285568 RepID=UPI001428B520|nr:hypothetical protein [Streptomyces bungoensis]
MAHTRASRMEGVPVGGIAGAGALRAVLFDVGGGLVVEPGLGSRVEAESIGDLVTRAGERVGIEIR